MNPYRDRLIDLARRYAGGLKQRPGAAGLALYGSLAVTEPREITRFSDIDYALVLEGEMPAHFVEHRVVEGIRLDVLFFRAGDIRGLIEERPYSLYERGWCMHFVIKSLLLGGPETIVFDPAGDLARAKRRLQEATRYEELARPDASEWFCEAVNARLAPAFRLASEGDSSGAVRHVDEAAAIFSAVLELLANLKSREAAAERFGIPEFHATACRLEALATPPGLEAVWQAARALWEHALERAYEPVKEALARAGLPRPAELELYGDYQLFWPGNRLHELSRVIDDMNLSLEWCRAKLDRGSGREGLRRLFYCRHSGSILERWERIDEASKAAGYDLSGIIRAFLDDPTTKRLAHELDQANARAELSASAAGAEEALRLAGELKAMLAGALPLMSPEELERHKVEHPRRDVRPL